MIGALLDAAVAVVVGASSGIGAATARALAAHGATIVAGYNSNEASALDLVGSLPQSRPHAALRIQTQDPASLAEAVQFLRNRYGRVDILVNSGGSTQAVPANDLEALTDELFSRIVDINLRGPFATIRAFRALLEVPDRSVIVNVSSIAARTGQGSNLAYCASKAGLDSLTVGLARVLAPKIRVFSVSPAGVDTGFVPGRTQEQLRATADRLPLRHVTTAEDVARSILGCILYLGSSTGIVVPTDEGRHLG